MDNPWFLLRRRSRRFCSARSRLMRSQSSRWLCCKPDVGVSQIRTTTVLSSCFCVGQTVL